MGYDSAKSLIRDDTMKKVVLIGLIAIICFLIILVAVGCIQPILPGSYLEILYPAPDAVVPTEFSVLAVAAKWSFGIETNTLLFLGTRVSRVGMDPCLVELSLDGVPYARSDGGNHHVFRISASPGDHTVGLDHPLRKYANRRPRHRRSPRRLFAFRSGQTNSPNCPMDALSGPFRLRSRRHLLLVSRRA